MHILQESSTKSASVTSILKKLYNKGIWILSVFSVCGSNYLRAQYLFVRKNGDKLQAD